MTYMKFIISLTENLRKYTFLSTLVYSFFFFINLMFISEIVEVDNIWINSFDVVNNSQHISLTKSHPPQVPDRDSSLGIRRCICGG